jgi:hypothetical protein
MAKAFLFLTALIFILISFTAALGGSIEFREVSTFTVPDIDSITAFDFGDIDKDGVPDILAVDRDHFVLYSFARDSVYFMDRIDTGSDLRYLHVLLKDVNRDSVPDIVIGCHDVEYARFWIQYYDGTGIDGMFHKLYREMVAGVFSFAWGMAEYEAFDAVDFDRDGYKELYFSLDSSWCRFCGIWDEYSGGVVRHYYRFPDSVKTQSRDLVHSPVYIHDQSRQYMIATCYQGSFNEIGPGYTLDEESGFYTFDGNTAAKRGGLNANWAMPHCAGDINLATPGNEILLDLQMNTLALYHFTPPDAFGQQWSLHFDGGIPSDITYLPLNPGYFFGFADNNFIQFSGVDGSEVFSTGDYPPGKRYWKDFYDIAYPYLVTVRGDTVAVFAVDVITSTAGEEPLPLPATLSLGKPYPNPFNATQTIPVTIVPGHELTVDVYNLLGQKVKTIYTGRPSVATLNLSWRADKFASGVYLIKATSVGGTDMVMVIIEK